MKYLEELRKNNPLTICLTNDVVKNFTANGLLAIGASPAMSNSTEDLKDLLKYAGGLLVNIGTACDDDVKLYMEAVDIADRLGVPVVLDPVACGASAFRMQATMRLLETNKISVLRGNAGEIASLCGYQVASKGVDSAGADDVEAIAVASYNKFKISTIVTGVNDAIANGSGSATLMNGSRMMPYVTGTGCLFGGVVAAFMGLSKGKSETEVFDILCHATHSFTIAGELAEEKTGFGRPGSFATAFLDSLYEIDEETIAKRAKTK